MKKKKKSLILLLNETYYGHFQLHNFNLGYDLNRITCYTAQKMQQFSHIAKCSSTVFHLCVKCFV